MHGGLGNVKIEMTDHRVQGRMGKTDTGKSLAFLVPIAFLHSFRWPACLHSGFTPQRGGGTPRNCVGVAFSSATARMQVPIGTREPTNEEHHRCALRLFVCLFIRGRRGRRCDLRDQK